ncbi:MAG TPA: hypothetical protein VIY48_16470, partial [Candidatus Paceibacterota bacterium]
GIDIFNTSTGGHDFQLFSTGSTNGAGAGNFGIYDQTSNLTPLNLGGSTGNLTVLSGSSIGFSKQTAFARDDADATLKRLTSGTIGVGSTTSSNGTLIAGRIGIGTTTPGTILSINSLANFTTATSTFYSTGGINLAGGCFAVNGTCLSTGGSSASSTLLSDSNIWSGTNTFNGNVLLVNATSTNFAVSGTASTTNLVISSLGGSAGQCLTTNSSGTVVATSCGVGGSGAFPFTPTTNFGATANATSTAIWFRAGLQASSTSQFDTANVSLLGFNATTSTSTLATFAGQRFLTASTTLHSMALGLGTLTNTTGTFNYVFGESALSSNSGGSNNLAFGYASLLANTTGNANIAFGNNSLFNNSTGSNNTALGNNALNINQTGSNNTALGASTLTFVSRGTNNTAVGYNAGSSVTTGYSNVFIGDVTNPGTTFGNISTGYGNIGIGASVYFPSTSGNSQLNIGNILFGTLPATTTTFTLPTSGAIGVGTTSPFAKFSIQNNNGDTETTLFAIGSSTASTNATLFSVSNTGSTTISNGINITAGCFAVNGTCLSVGGNSASSTLLSDSNTWSGNNTFTNTP